MLYEPRRALKYRDRVSGFLYSSFEFGAPSFLRSPLLSFLPNSSVPPNQNGLHCIHAITFPSPSLPFHFIGQNARKALEVPSISSARPPPSSLPIVATLCVPPSCPLQESAPHPGGRGSQPRSQRGHHRLTITGRMSAAREPLCGSQLRLERSSLSISQGL